MVIVVVLAVVLIFVPLLLWGLNRMRGNRSTDAKRSVDGRGSVNVVGILFVFVMLGVGIAVPLLLLYGNHDNASKQVHGVKLTAEARSGRTLFGQHCAVCHTLAAANAIGKVGPNLDVIHPPKALVLHTIANGCVPNATVKTESEACLGQGVMPAEVVTGQDAQDVASFVAQAAESKRNTPAAGSGSASASSGSSGSTSTSGGGSSGSTSTSGGGSSGSTSTSGGGSTGTSTSGSTGTSTSGSTGTSTSGGGSSSGVSLKAGMSVFESTCASCHTLAAAGSTGTVGPNLDQLKPSDALVVHQVTNGGGGMPAFGSSLSATQIKSVALFVSSVAGKPVKGKVKTTGNATP